MSDPAPGDPWFALIDTAQDPQLYPLVLRAEAQQCLIAGDVAPVLAETLPYLVQLDPEGPVLQTWRERGMGCNWGILLRSALPIDALRLHFKKFLQAKLPDGTIALFRYYDPRVFRTYLRAATPEERAPWFAGVSLYSVEGATPGEIHNFHLSGGRLHDGATALS